MSQQIVGFRSEPNCEWPVLAGSDCGDDIGVANELQCDLLRPLFNLLLFYGCRAVICNCRTGNEDIALGYQGQTLVQHLTCTGNRHDPSMLGCLQAYRTAHQCSEGAGVQGRLGQGIAHFSGAMVRDIAHRVQSFPGWPGGNDDLFPTQQACVELGRRCCGDHRGLFHAARANVTAGLFATGGAHYGVAAGGEGSHIGSSGFVPPHLLVHGRRQ